MAAGRSPWVTYHLQITHERPFIRTRKKNWPGASPVWKAVGRRTSGAEGRDLLLPPFMEHVIVQPSPTYTLLRDGQEFVVRLGGRRTLAEILTDEEYDAIRAGSLEALTSSGGLMDLSSPLAGGERITLRESSRR